MKFKTAEKLAGYVIGYYLSHSKKPLVNENCIDERLKNKAACFVTVYVRKELRGCIGNSVAVGPLYESIIENTIFAVKSDYRFEPITKIELPQLTVEVSILSTLSEYHPASSQQLLDYLKQNHPGLVIEKNGQSALFLPQVWDDLPQPELFLSQLCLKAGLKADDWIENTQFKIFHRVSENQK
jgi:AmmeMemoRadiSam system protein A